MHRARLVAGLAMLGGIFGTAYTAFYLAIGHNWGAAIIVICTVAMVLVPFLMRVTGRIGLAGNLHALIWTLGFSGLGVVEGGVHGHAIAWLACGVPLLSLMVLERRAALIWCGVCLLATLGFCALAVAGISLRLAYPTQWYPQVTLVGYVGLAVFIALLGLIAEASRQAAFRGMQKSERFVQRIADTTPGLIYMFDVTENNLVYANQRLVEALGLEHGDALNIHAQNLRISSRAPEFDRILRELRETMLGARNGEVLETQYEFDRGGQKVFWLCHHTVFSRTSAGEPQCILGLAEDVTERRWTEQANRAKDQFLAVLSHELRTPLTPVLVTVSAMESRKDLPSYVRADMSLIKRNIELESKLIDDLLDVTKISHGKLVLNREVVDSHDCLRDVLEMARNEIDAKRIAVSLELKAASRHICADPVRFRQVLWNLLRNAVKFTPEGGRITLRTFNSNAALAIQIADTGIGIEPDAIRRIFNAFEQAERTKSRRYGGMGLGLSIAKAIVELHQGRLSAASAGRDEGATFTVELGTVPAESEEPRPVAVPVRESAAPGRILLVEDHPDTLQILSALLRSWGYTVTGAQSIKKGLECAARQDFDMVISDLGLPDGSGCELMREIKERYGLRGIALSGYGTDDDIRESLDAGFRQHLAKPVSSDGLRNAIREALSEAA